MQKGCTVKIYQKTHNAVCMSDNYPKVHYVNLISVYWVCKEFGVGSPRKASFFCHSLAALWIAMAVIHKMYHCQKPIMLILELNLLIVNQPISETQ